MTPDPTSDRLGTCDRLHVIGNPVPRSPHVLMYGCINWTPLPEPLGTCDYAGKPGHNVPERHTKRHGCVNWTPLPEEPTPSEGISDEELEAQETGRWVYCDECNGIGSDENVPFFCAACKGEGGTWQTVTEMIQLLDAAEATIAELRDSLDAEREIGSLLNVRDLAAANQRIAELEGVISARHRVGDWLKPPYRCQCGTIDCPYLAALSTEEKT